MAHAYDWFKRGGERDLRDAERLLQNGSYENAFHLAREGVELLLKSLLIKQGVPEREFIKQGGIRHDYLKALQRIDWRKIQKADRRVIEKAVNSLIHFEMESGDICCVKQVSLSRYPEKITKNDAERTIQLAYNIYREVRKEFQGFQ